MGKNNSMTYFGLVTEKTPSTNEILAFTTGELTNAGWDSEKAANLDDIIQRVRDGVKVHKRVSLAVPTNGTRTSDFNKLLDEKQKNQKINVLKIRVFLPELKAFKINLLLKGVTVGPILPNGDPEHDPKKGGSMFKVCKLKVDEADFEAP